MKAYNGWAASNTGTAPASGETLKRVGIMATETNEVSIDCTALVSNGRVDVAVVGRAIRAAFLQFKRSGLGAFERRTLEAVVCVVATYSRLADRVTVSQLAQYVFDVDGEHVLGRHRSKVQEALSALSRADVIAYQPWRGRSPGGVEQAVIVGIPAIESHPGIGVTSQDLTPICVDSHPDLCQNSPRTGWHTEKYPEEVDEKRDAFLVSADRRWAKRTSVTEEDKLAAIARARAAGHDLEKFTNEIRLVDWPSEYKPLIPKPKSHADLATAAFYADLEAKRSTPLDDAAPPQWRGMEAAIRSKQSRRC